MEAGWIMAIAGFAAGIVLCRFWRDKESLKALAWLLAAIGVVLLLRSLGLTGPRPKSHEQQYRDCEEMLHTIP